MNRLQSYTAQQCKRIPALLHAYERHRNPEYMHQLRVAIKKLRAVVRYMRTYDGKPLKKFAHHLRDFFRQAGALREIEIQMEWLQQNGGTALVAVLQYQKTIDAHIAGLQPLIPHFIDAVKDYSPALLRLCHQQHPAALQAYAAALKNELLQQAQHAQPNGWHELRKLIKQLLYAWHWLDADGQAALLTQQQYTYFDQLQEYIGNWHDALLRTAWLGDTQLYLHTSAAVRQAFAVCWQHNRQQVQAAEKKVRQQLRRIPHLFKSLR